MAAAPAAAVPLSHSLTMSAASTNSNLSVTHGSSVTQSVSRTELSPSVRPVASGCDCVLSVMSATRSLTAATHHDQDTP